MAAVSPLSVVIPTYNNATTLVRCLEALERQTFPLNQMEVIVMVDGSRDQTMERLAAYEKRAPFRLTYANHANQGPGPMRNKGIQAATHDLILIINDDFLADPQLLQKHVDWHAQHPAKEYALLGFVEELACGDSDFKLSRLDKAFNRLKDLPQLEWHHFYTTNVSLKKRFLVESNEWFSSAFPHPVYEDVEMGYRLSRHGLRLFIDTSARGLHHHPMSYAQYARRAYHSGICLSVFYKLHPELKDYLIGRGLISSRWEGFRPLKSHMASLVVNRWSVTLFETMAKKLNRLEFRRSSEFLFWRLFGYYQRKGVEEGLERFVYGSASSAQAKQHAHS